MISPSDMPKRHELAPLPDPGRTPDPWEVEDQRLQRVLDQVRGVYEQVAGFAEQDDAESLTRLVFDRFDEGARP